MKHETARHGPMSDRAVELKDEVKRQAERARGEIPGAEDVAALVERQQHVLADEVDAIEHALHAASSSLRDEGSEAAARYTEMGADQVAWVSRGLREKRPAELLHATEDFARENPAVFFGGAVLLGVALSRFLKSTEAPEEEPARLEPPATTTSREPIIDTRKEYS